MLVAGARPNFMKIAPLIRELEDRGGAEWMLVHTGQHYDFEMSRVFFDELEIPEPHFFLGSGSGSHAEQTARVMVQFEKICFKEAPQLVVVVGDVNSTLACSVTARKLHIEVAHVEAGLRSGDWGMPEEINRIVTDALSNYLFVTEKSGVENLRAEGRPEESIHLVGNTMIDTLLYQLVKIESDPEIGAFTDTGGDYAVVTLHRPSNVDEKENLDAILEALAAISRDMPVIFPAHPRTAGRITDFDLQKILDGSKVRLVPPAPYRSFLRLWKDARLVLTDSGGLQEETTALGVPCFTLRENTERPVTMEEGTNTLAGVTTGSILEAYQRFKESGPPQGRVPDLWDGQAAGRILDILLGRRDRDGRSQS